ncbi:hypothetical protein IJG93_02000 [Candidatus Saccharibacteria bacterium]|nr:hypothetical protein [Candidatus Saccharibacteria bacterium]
MLFVILLMENQKLRLSNQSVGKKNVYSGFYDVVSLFPLVQCSKILLPTLARMPG